MWPAGPRACRKGKKREGSWDTRDISSAIRVLWCHSVSPTQERGCTSAITSKTTTDGPPRKTAEYQLDKFAPPLKSGAGISPPPQNLSGKVKWVSIKKRKRIQRGQNTVSPVYPPCLTGLIFLPSPLAGGEIPAPSLLGEVRTYLGRT